MDTHEASSSAKEDSRVHQTSMICPFNSCHAIIEPGNLDEHVKLAHTKLNLKINVQSNNEEKFNCTEDNCESSFSDEQSLTSHILTVHHELIQCPQENCTSFMKRASLSRHIRSIHEKSKETCPNCGKLISFSTVKRHLESCTHDGVRKFPCPIEDCKSTSKTNYGLRAHIKQVHRDQISKCPYENCNALVKPANLTSHIKFVHDKANHQCKRCGRYFYCLENHYEKCSGEERGD